MLSLTEAKERLSGPIPTIRTPFDRDGNIDYKGLGCQIEFVLAAGARCVALTAGDSHLIALSDREIAELTAFVAKQVAKRALVVAADRYYDTKQAVAFADYCKDSGCDILMLMPPDWGASATPETLSDHYSEVAKRIPVMIVTNVFIPRGYRFGLETVELSLRKSANILSIKDDMCGDFARKLSLVAGDRAAVWAGGQKVNHMNMAAYGACGYLSSFMLFKPEIAHNYWAACRSGDMKAAIGIIRDYDMPYFELALATVKGGFDACIHGTLELFGICGRWRPKPYYNLSEGEMETLAERLRALHILDR